MANNQNTSSTILSEHRKIVGTRYVLATLNFLAVLLGMIVTLFFVSRRGIYDAVLTVIWALIIINVVQIVLCVGEYILRVGFGINVKALPAISYIVGGLWLAALALELVLATVEAGTLRTDLLIVACIQAVVALVAYILWPNLDRRAIDSMIKPSSRGDEKKRARKAKRYVATYGVLTVLIVLAQAATLLLYKMPPTFYDLFADNRALQYELNEDKDGYIVSAVYNGTSPYVNIPATYNNLPVVGIKAGALVDDGIIEKYKITSITFGTPEKDENGNEVMKSNLQFINSGAIVCSRVETISIPESVTALEDGAIRGAALRTVEYSARANFKYSAFSGCTSLARILMSGERVGVIASLEGMPDKVNIQVDKDIYNSYRESNLNYVSSFSPILADDEFCIDFFTGCDYYIDSIFAKKGETVKLSYASLKKDGAEGTPLSVDTLAYIGNAHELGTDGAKADAAFRGWYYDPSYVAKAEFTEYGEISLTESTKIYAKWINEYNATLNWGTYKPAGQVDKVYWTDEDIRSFPVVTDRNGYSKGVVWTNAGTGEKLTNSDGISESIALTAAWQFDAPTISLDYVLNGGSETITVGGATFVYDETKTLQLSALKSHALEKDQINNTVDYDYEWYKDGKKIDAFANTDVVRLQNVLESGVYTLRVTATPHYYADAGTYAEINYNVQITKKALNLGDVTFNYLAADKQFIYNGGMQSCVIEGNVATPGVGVTYTYANDNGYTSGSGMINAGAYDVTATFAKVDPAEADNYATATLTTRATVKPIVLSTPTWSNNSFVYDKAEHGVYISFAEAIAGEDVGVVYEGASATNAGNYTAIVKDITNTNYTRVGVDANLLSCSWTIAPKVITVQNWTLNGSSASTVTYTGSAHKVTAETDGVIHGDVINFKYDEDGSTMSATNVGKYIAKVTGVTNSNYTLDTSATFAWEIKPAKLTVTFNNSGKLTYNGKAQSIYATVSGIVEEDVDAFAAKDFDTEGTTATVSLAAGDNANSVKLLFSATNVGKDDYVAKINGLLSGDQHLANYVIETAASNSFNITPKLLEVRPVEKTYTYNGEEQYMLLMVDGVLTQDRANITFTIGEGGNKVDDVTSGVFIRYAGMDAGDYATSVTAVGDTNYQLVRTYNTPLTIGKKVVTISNWTIFDNAKNALIEWSENGYTYNKAGYKVGYTLAGAVEGENVTLALTNAEYVAASSNYYTTTARLDSANDINKNYSFTSTSVQWKINPKDIALTWKVDNGTQTSFVYSRTEHEVDYTVKGLIEGDEINITYKTGENALNATNAGSYKVTVASIGNSNYKIASGASFAWSITPKPVDIVWSVDGKSNSSLVYNGNFREVTVVVKEADIIAGDAVNVTATGQMEARAASSYAAIAKSLDNANYQIDSKATKEFNWVINPLPITVAWEDKTEFVYNAKTQNPIATITNLCGSDTALFSYFNCGQNVGTHTVKIGDLDNSNYTIEGVIERTYTITPKVVVPTWTNYGFVYNASAKTQDATYKTGASADDDGFVYSGDTLEFKYEGNKATNAGNYSAKIIATGNSNYVLTDDVTKTTYGWTIAQCPVTLSWSYSKTTYNSEIQYPVATVTNKYSQSVSVTSYTGIGLSAETKGTYAITADGLDNSNFTLVGGKNLTQDYSIAPLTLTYEWYGVRADNTEIARDITKLVYDGYQTRVLVRFTNVCSGDEIVPVYANNVLLDADTTGKTVTVTLDGADKDNYTFSGISKTVTVAPQPVKITWSGNANPIYNGQTHKLTATVVGTKAGASYNVGHTVSASTGANADGSYTNAGTYTYTITLNGTDAKNFTLTNSEGSNKATLKIAQKEITVTWGNLNHVYDGAQKTATAYSNEAGVTVSLSGASRTNAGSQTVTATSTDSNYKVTNNTQTLVISKAKIKLTWVGLADVVYDGQVHKPTVTLSNHSGTSVIPSYTIKYNGSTSTNPANAGSYTVVFTLGDTTNYELTAPNDASKSFTIAQKVVRITSWSTDEFYYDGSTKTLTAILDDAGAQSTIGYKNNTQKNAGETTATVTVGSNYKFADGTVTTHKLTVKKAIVTVTWKTGEATSVTYDGQNHRLTATLSSNTGAAVSSYYTYNGSSLSYVKAAGNYTVIVVLSDTANFEFASNSTTQKSLIVKQKEISVNWDSINTDMTYRANKSYGIAPTLVGAVSGDSVSFVYSGATSVSDAGTYTLSITSLSGSQASNYKLPTSGLQKTFVVKPQAVTISWSGLTTTYNGALQKPTLTVRGKLDTGVNVAYSPITGNDNVGNYDYEVILTNSNFTLEGCTGNVEATMTIKPQAVTITWPSQTSVTYTGNPQRLTPTVKNANGSTISASLITVDGASGVNVGTYRFTVSDIDDDNYTLAGVSNTTATLEILPRAVTITWNNMSQTYGMMNDDIVFATLNNAVYGEDVRPVVVGYQTTLAAGSHTLRVTGLEGEDSTNYQLSASANTSATLSVAKQKAVAEWSDTSFVYDGTYHAPTLTVTGMDGEDLSRFVTTANIPTHKDAGVYTYYASNYFQTNPNYELQSNTSCTMNITAKKIYTSDFAVYFSKATNGFSVKFNGLLEGDEGEVTVADSKLIITDDYASRVTNGTIYTSGTYSIRFNASDIVTSANYSIVNDGTNAKPYYVSPADIA